MSNKDNKDNLEKEDIVPFTQKNEPEKKSKVGIYSIVASVILGCGVLGGSYLLTQNNKENANEPKTEQTTQTSEEDNIVDGFNVKYKDMVDVDGHKSLEEKVVNFSEEPFNDGYKLQNNNLTYLNGVDAEKLMNSNDRFLVYVGRPNCPYCHMFRQIQDKVLKELDANIYSIDTIYARYDTKLYDLLDSKLGVETVPEVLVIEKGEVKARLFDDLGEDNGFKEENVKNWFVNNLK